MRQGRKFYSGGSSSEVNPPIGDPVVCANRKLGADFTSNAPLEATHTLGSLYDTNGVILAFNGSFVVTDSLNNTHSIDNGQTVSGLSPGPTQQVAFTGEIHWTDPVLGEFRCQVTSKLISANFTVQ